MPARVCVGVRIRADERARLHATYTRAVPEAEKNITPCRSAQVTAISPFGSGRTSLDRCMLIAHDYQTTLGGLGNFVVSVDVRISPHLCPRAVRSKPA